MPYKGDPIAEKLDRIAEATGVPRMSRRFEQAMPLRLRLLPVALLALAVAGLWVQIARSPIYGYTIVMAAWAMSFPLQQLSPLRQAQRGKLDERERALVRSGHFAGLVAALGVAVLGCVFIGMGSAATLIRIGDFWAPHTPTDWFAGALFLLAVESNVAVLAASSAMPEPLEDED
ncbi:MAG: hypothetical protein P0Y56_15620 [Candidatus Andeanibacterium colombiense]|uniref:Transmembrane protein n=1 Tax=Candidatus Andeanibacterium colombiense TaxID=3121345 RepID=A0AAJ5X5K3_9SPHN|nr:MAG: hypothetical protein P0Y56_15620 [Sphingomonadaceae bacterium]